jgi:hypothetical protein
MMLDQVAHTTELLQQFEEEPDVDIPTLSDCLKEQLPLSFWFCMVFSEN